MAVYDSENRLKKAEGKPAVKKILTPKAKSDIAIEAIKAQLTWAQISSKHKVSPPVINKLKKVAEQSILRGFTNKPEKALALAEEKNEDLLKMLGEAQLEISWLKKKSSRFAE